MTVGDYSYFERHAEAIYTTIGKFCSIAANTRINALEHPLERVTMHKLSYRPNEYFRYLGVDEAFRQRRQGKRVTIGHDVWIGHGAVVMPGLAIANGAVVGANAVVTRDVAAYTIVAGNPARLLRPRFTAGYRRADRDAGLVGLAAGAAVRGGPRHAGAADRGFLERWGGQASLTVAPAGTARLVPLAMRTPQPSHRVGEAGAAMIFEKPFTRIANYVAHAAGLPATFIVCCAVIVVWAVTGPIFGFSDTWQLIINTGTTIVTFLMVFLIQNTQNRDSAAI